jgi:hypothetical protein
LKGGIFRKITIRALYEQARAVSLRRILLLVAVTFPMKLTVLQAMLRRLYIENMWDYKQNIKEEEKRQIRVQ